VSQVIVPVLNSAFAATARHVKFDNDGIMTDVGEPLRRRASGEI
jgi:hypothetical protein